LWPKSLKNRSLHISVRPSCGSFKLSSEGSSFLLDRHSGLVKEGSPLRTLFPYFSFVSPVLPLFPTLPPSAANDNFRRVHSIPFKRFSNERPFSRPPVSSPPLGPPQAWLWFVRKSFHSALAPDFPPPFPHLPKTMKRLERPTPVRFPQE